MNRKICALLQKKPEPVFAMDKAPKERKQITKKPAKEKSLTKGKA
ncbi:hypothetical protein UFOVP148_65 [uncultured Caudovirales phage]|uniref:Uncharacterized protein n=1 Tax=uncultured Caudovirales phage TaxID=2100421 RepID=A0A6J7W536_9CAUD|nr:hypothetical protein UFOVP148_65 [uncultured Caudovirales phage]